MPIKTTAVATSNPINPEQLWRRVAVLLRNLVAFMQSKASLYGTLKSSARASSRLIKQRAAVRRGKREAGRRGMVMELGRVWALERDSRPPEDSAARLLGAVTCRLAAAAAAR